MSCNLPIDCVLALTYNCNSRCTMCDIWKIKDSPELEPQDFLKLPSSLRDVNLSGGEPFLHKNLLEIVKNIKTAAPHARLVISSNGFATELIVKKMKEILAVVPNIGVAISIDGIGEMHNEIRGIPGGFEKAIKTIYELKKLGMQNLRLAFTVMEKNVNHFSKVYDLSQELGIQFTHSFAQSSEFYFGGKQNIENPRRDLLVKQYEHIIGSELKSWNFKKWARGWYAVGMFNFITSHNPMLSNAPGRDFFFVDPSGDIYPSVVHNVVINNLNKFKDASEFAQFWCSSEADMVRVKIDDLKIPVWMICTARTAIKKHPFSAGWWLLKNKFFGFKLV